MKKINVVFEAPSKWDAFLIKRYVNRNIPVWVVEPFHAFHHKKGILFFPPHLPVGLKKLIHQGKLSILAADEINAREIYLQSADKAVKVIEAVYPEYRKEHKDFVQLISNTLNNTDAENVFKKELCRRLAEFYSVNIMLHRIKKLLGTGNTLFYPDTNVGSYHYLKTLISRSGQEVYEHRSIVFPKSAHFFSFLENIRKNLAIKGKLLLQTLVSGLLAKTESATGKKKGNFAYGVLITSPRQFDDDRRGPDFIVDNKKIKREEMVYLPVITLKGDRKRGLEQMGSEVIYPAKPGRLFSHFTEWKKLLSHSLQRDPLRNAHETDAACIAFFSYFRWLKVLDRVNIKTKVRRIICVIPTGVT
jgi:hypothetical protein